VTQRARSGAVGTTRAQDFLTGELIRRAMHDAAEERRVAAERAFLARMGGSCQTPLAAHATYEGDQLAVTALCGTPDGRRILRATSRGAADRAEALGIAAAEDLLAQGAGEIVAACAT
jgi:hydroxymethylbilane synthase